LDATFSVLIMAIVYKLSFDCIAFEVRYKLLGEAKVSLLSQRSSCLRLVCASYAASFWVANFLSEILDKLPLSFYFLSLVSSSLKIPFII